jgi:hypothetical protein
MYHQSPDSFEMRSKLVSNDVAAAQLPPNGPVVQHLQSADISGCLRNDFSSFHFVSPTVSSAAPQAISSMGIPVPSAIHHVAQATFVSQGAGWNGNVSNPDIPSSREARIQHAIASTLNNGRGLDLKMQTRICLPFENFPDIQALLDSNEKIVASLNCAEVHGAPDSSTMFSKGFVQASIVESNDSTSRRLIIFTLSGNVTCAINENMEQTFSSSTTTTTQCCCFENKQGQSAQSSSAQFDYKVVSQSQSELTILNIPNSVVRVQITKKKLDSLNAMTNPPHPPQAAPSILQMTERRIQQEVDDGCPTLCSCFENTQVHTVNGGRQVRYQNSVSRDIGYNSILNVGGASKPVTCAVDIENGSITASDTDGAAHILTSKKDIAGTLWKIEELREDRVVIEISYRSVLHGSIKTCYLVMNNATDTSKVELTDTSSKYAQSDTKTLALAWQFASKLLPR